MMFHLIKSASAINSDLLKETESEETHTLREATNELSSETMKVKSTNSNNNLTNNLNQVKALTVGDLIGGWGAFQWNIFIFDITVQMSTMANILSMSFMAPKVIFHCLDENNISVNSSNIDETTSTSSFISSSSSSSSLAVSQYASSCTINDPLTNETSKACSSFSIDTSIFGETLTSEYSLICDRTYLASTAQALYVAGYLVASFVAGWSSDRFGRSPVLWASVVGELIAGIACSLSFSMWFFMFFRFLLGVAVYAKFLTAYTMVIEVAGSHERTVYGPLTRMGRSIGTIVITILAYYIRSFRQLHLVITLPSALWLYWLTKIPESPRWLIIKGRIDQATQVVLNAAQVNGIDLSENGIDDVHDEINKMYTNIISTVDKNQDKKLTSKSFIDLFRTPIIRKNSIIMCFNWFIIVFIYYSLSLNVQDLGGNMYVNFFISGLVEFPSILLCIYALRIAGRRTILALSCALLFISASISIPFFLLDFEGSVSTRVAFVMLGK